MHAAGLDVERFRKVRTLHDRTDIPGERAAAASRMEAMARNAGISLDEALKKTGGKAPRKPRAKKAAAEHRKPAPRRPKAEPRPMEWQRIIIEYGSEAAVLSRGPWERALSQVTDRFLVHRAVNGWRVGSLLGWTRDSAEDPPPAVIKAVSAAYPLPATVQNAWAEFYHWTKLFRDRAVFSPRLGTPPLAVEIRKRLLAGLLDVIEARSLNDVRARLDWMDDRAAQDGPRDVEGDANRLRILRADFERMAGRLRRTAERQPNQGGYRGNT